LLQLWLEWGTVIRFGQVGRGWREFLKPVGTVAAAGLATIAALQMVLLSKYKIRAIEVAITLRFLGDIRGSGFVIFKIAHG
jgi:hypothetical protein